MSASIVDIQILNLVDAGCSMREMEARTHLSASTCNQYVKRMVLEGLIQDPPKSPTGRAISRGYRLTKKGNDYLIANGYKRA